jgi:hypothetical protein
MLPSFNPWHIPALFVATATTFGGLWPIWNPRGAMLEFGFPPSVADDTATHPVMVTASARTTALGALMFVFYIRGDVAAVDTIIALFGAYGGLMDWYALRGLEDQNKAVFRLISGLAIGAWGFFGMSSR